MSVAVVSVALVRRKVTKREPTREEQSMLETTSRSSSSDKLRDTTPSVDQLYDTVEGCDMDLTENQAYAAIPNISVEPNQCYGTTTLSVDPDQLYDTVQMGHTITNTSQQPTAVEYEFPMT